MVRGFLKRGRVAGSGFFTEEKLTLHRPVDAAFRQKLFDHFLAFFGVFTSRDGLEDGETDGGRCTVRHPNSGGRLIKTDKKVSSQSSEDEFLIAPGDESWHRTGYDGQP